MKVFHVVRTCCATLNLHPVLNLVLWFILKEDNLAFARGLDPALAQAKPGKNGTHPQLQAYFKGLSFLGIQNVCQHSWFDLIIKALSSGLITSVSAALLPVIFSIGVS